MIYPHDSKLQYAQMPSGLIVPHDCLPKPRPKAFDFFAGCGGFSCGLHQAGFQVIGALEMDFSAAQTYMVNLGNYPCQIHFDSDDRMAAFEKHLSKQIEKQVKRDGFISMGTSGSGWIKHAEHQDGCEHFWIADIYNINGKMILSWLEMEKGELDLVVGSPPCQGFSRAGKQDVNDPRNTLTFEFGRLITELYPKSLCMENVPEMATAITPEGISILEGFCKILADGDYAPFESLQKSLIGRKGAKAILRSEKKQKNKKKIQPKPKKAKSAQASLF